jgi:dienelactone hydrolase
VKHFLFALVGMLLALPAHAALKTKTVEYKDGDVVLEGYAAWDDAHKGPRPAVLVFHEWWGHGPYVRKRADMLAQMGYVAFAVDMYGKGVKAKNHEEAGKLAGTQFADRAMMRRRATAGLEAMKKLPGVDAGRIAAIGYCFGGAAVLELARMGTDIRGVASFHGALATPQPATVKPKAKILVLHGADDGNTSPMVAGFMDEMKSVGADWELDIYGGAVHSFTVAEAGNDNSKGIAYNAEADARSWARLKTFLDEIFK